MTQAPLSAYIARADIFQGLSADQLERISRRTERVLFQPGDDIAVQGETSDQAILIVEGEIDCIAGVGADAEFVGDQGGKMLGEMAMFIDDFEHPATFKARVQTKALLINRNEMLEELAQDPEMTEYLVQRVSSRLNNMIAEMRRIESDFSSGIDQDAPAQLR
ncbi:MAG: cyclic nucleotide-binding domain-containing protein [Pseudomonadota bacterium]